MIAAVAPESATHPQPRRGARPRPASQSLPGGGPRTAPRLTKDELDAIREEALANLGEEDARHIRAVVRVARVSAVAGRTLLMFGITPLSFGAGVGALALAKILENMEVGHNVLHGQYDWMNDPALDSRTYEWDIVSVASQWKHYHNYEHHTFTNILGKDRDIGYGVVRIDPEQRWSPKHLVQPISNVALSLWFQWGVGLHDMDTARALRDPARHERLAAQWREFAAKAGGQLFKDYVLFPALAGWNAPRVLAGNLAANAIRNVWTNVVIFCGHFPEGTRVFTQEEAANESRGGWYLRQILGSANIEGGHWLHVLTGHLSHQIEHHLFPDVPAWRYPAMAPRVRAVCERYGLPYNSAGLAEQYASVLGKVLRNAVPPSMSHLISRITVPWASGTDVGLTAAPVRG